MALLRSEVDELDATLQEREEARQFCCRCVAGPCRSANCPALTGERGLEDTHSEASCLLRESFHSSMFHRPIRIGQHKASTNAKRYKEKGSSTSFDHGGML